jgi:L-alanine-DL-glutamate epimerase-like enolase superfamily enzyme
VRTHAITAVEIHVVSGPAPEPPSELDQTQVRPLHIYPEHRPDGPREMPRGGTATSRYLRIGTDSGAEGLYGPVDPEACWTIGAMLAPFLLGQDALAGALTWDKLDRLDRHARHGHLKMAISAVDNALWDLRGRVFDAPVWQLLGGGARSRIPAYASTLGTSLEPDSVSQTATLLAKEGFLGQKWFLAHGPAGGKDGLRANVALAQQLRDVLGPEEDIMFDVFGGWDLPYALAWTQRVDDTLPTWLEEPVGPNRYHTFVELSRRSPVPLSAGEHLYDRNDVVPYLTDSVITTLQTDPEWCGGVTELVKICALAETFGVPVIPHGHGLHAALHVIASQSPATCPKAEYLVRIMPGRHHFELSPPTPEGGSFALPTGSGFGIELDDSKIEKRSVLDRF